MPSINLITSHREEKRRYEQHVRRLAYAVAGEVGVILLVASVLTLRLSMVRGDVQQLDNQIAKLEPKVNNILALQTQTKALQPEVTTLNEARNNTLYWYTSLQSVVACLPQQSWLTSINTSGDPTPPAPAPKAGLTSSSPAPAAPATAPPTLSVAGMAATSNDVGAAMVRMNQYNNIASVTLGGLQQGAASPTDNKATTMSFNLTVNLKPNTAQDVTTPGFPAAPVADAPAAQPAKVAAADPAGKLIKKFEGGSHV